MNPKPHSRVGVALITRNGWYLITRRKPGVHLAGYWEFPGGKCEVDESPEDCVQREVLEELAVEVTQPIYMMTHYHEYPEKSVDLIVFHCSIIGGDPKPVDCVDLRWVKPEEFCEFEFPPADTPIIRALLDGTSEIK